MTRRSEPKQVQGRCCAACKVPFPWCGNPVCKCHARPALQAVARSQQLADAAMRAELNASRWRGR